MGHGLIQSVIERGFFWYDILDILFVAIILYFLITKVRGTRAVQIFAGLIVLIVAYWISGITKLQTLNRFLQNIIFYIPFVIIVLFEQTIRTILTSIATPLFRHWKGSSGDDLVETELSRAAFKLAEQKTGAIIVIEGTQGLRNYIEKGVQINSKISTDLILSIFHPGNPLHDGAVIISEGRIEAAACFLPITASAELPLYMGTRHRAAVGITEETDAIAIIASEENGAVSICRHGKIEKINEASMLKDTLLRYKKGEE